MKQQYAPLNAEPSLQPSRSTSLCVGYSEVIILSDLEDSIGGNLQEIICDGICFHPPFNRLRSLAVDLISLVRENGN